MNIPVQFRFWPMLAFVALLGWSTGCSREPENRNFQPVASDDEAMNHAVETAKATVQTFVAAYEAKRPGTSQFTVKKPFPTPGGGKEHMWIEVTALQDGQVTGLVANDAEETKQVNFGDVVKFPITEITDWQFREGRKVIGGYTLRYFVDRMSPAEKAEFLKSVDFEL